MIYGHGASAVAPLLQKEGADRFAVSNLEEADELRRCGVDRPILILGYTPPEAAEDLARLDVAQAVYDLDYAEALSDRAKALPRPVRVHLKLDTGMGRLGFDCRTDALNGLQDAQRAAELSGLTPEGIFTHFAVADTREASDLAFTENQFRRFDAAVAALRRVGEFPVRHCCNSAGLLLHPAMHADLCRPGIILYGLYPDPALRDTLDLRPVMTFKSVVSMVKRLPAGTAVSYGRTYTTPDDRLLATVSAGYADGVSRHLSNCGQVYLRGGRAPIVGRVCMDQFLIDVTELPGVARGDEVEIFGSHLSAEEQAAAAGTISYELVCAVSKRVPRVYCGENV